MNLNDNSEELKKEEQKILDNLISRMDQELDSLDEDMKEYVAEAKNADIRLNPDLYLAKLLAKRGMKDTEKNRQSILDSRDKLYEYRLLVQWDDSIERDIEEIKAGLHSCIVGADTLITSWLEPVCRHYVLDNASVEYQGVTVDKYGEEFLTNYRLLVKEKVELRFTHVKKAVNLFPGIFDKELLEEIKGTGFFSEEYLDKMIKKFNPEDYDPDMAAKIISDEFLLELLERRTTPEFKNIVFSIQKEQSRIIQSPYKRNMIVQGCAGSGKSMIMLHRLPILLYDSHDSIKRESIYIVTPSQMYIQLATNMRHQLEISDINMGTIEQYYDYCISKYPGHSSSEYGRINYNSKINCENERYVYSRRCMDDIHAYYDSIVKKEISLDKAYSIFPIKEETTRLEDTYSKKISNSLLKLNHVIEENDRVLLKYFKAITNVLDSLFALGATLRNRKSNVTREIAKSITKSNEIVAKAKKELKELNPEENAVAVRNRNMIIQHEQNRIIQLYTDKESVEGDDDYFALLLELNNKIESVIKPFDNMKDKFSLNETENIYAAINNIGQLIGGCYMILWEVSKVEDRYVSYLDAINNDAEKVGKNVAVLQNIKSKYLDYSYYDEIISQRNTLKDAVGNAVKNAYELVMGNIGIKPSASGNIRAIKCSPYIYLQAIYCYQGAPLVRESLLAIDEAQGLSPEELRLLKAVNGNNVVFNMFGDIYQHIEETKGIDSWDEYKGIVDFDMYELKENYRNASQITEYCNNQFGMKMRAINTPGKGVHELKSESEFYTEMSARLMDTQREGLAAVLVSNDAEARYLLDKFPTYEHLFNDMTGENSGIHSTRWNIINIDDANGLEFTSVFVLSGRMSNNQRYIAFTRALDALYVYSNVIDIKDYEKKKRNVAPDSTTSNTEAKQTETTDRDVTTNPGKHQSKHANNKTKSSYENSEVRKFFEEKGLEVIDNREQSGRLWVIGDKKEIREIVNEAISKFGISGKYAIGKESKNRSGWYTKTRH